MSYFVFDEDKSKLELPYARKTDPQLNTYEGGLISADNYGKLYAYLVGQALSIKKISTTAYRQYYPETGPIDSVLVYNASVPSDMIYIDDAAKTTPCLLGAVMKIPANVSDPHYTVSENIVVPILYPWVLITDSKGAKSLKMVTSEGFTTSEKFQNMVARIHTPSEEGTYRYPIEIYYVSTGEYVYNNMM